MNETKIDFEANVDALRLAYQLLLERNPEGPSIEDALLRRALSLINDEIYFWKTCPPEVR